MAENPNPLALPTANDGLTLEQSAIVAGAIFQPTVQRMSVLMAALIAQTASGDYALWAPLSAMDHTIRDLKWEAVPPANARNFAALAVEVLRRYADRMQTYAEAIAQYAAAPAGTMPFPELQEWTDDDTMAAYDTVLPQAPTLTPKEDSNG